METQVSDRAACPEGGVEQLLSVGQWRISFQQVHGEETSGALVLSSKYFTGQQQGKELWGGGLYVDKMEYAKVKRLKIAHVFTLGKLFPQSLFNAIKHLQHCVF